MAKIHPFSFLLVKAWGFFLCSILGVYVFFGSLAGKFALTIFFGVFFSFAWSHAYQLFGIGPQPKKPNLKLATSEKVSKSTSTQRFVPKTEKQNLAHTLFEQSAFYIPSKFCSFG